MAGGSAADNDALHLLFFFLDAYLSHSNGALDRDVHFSAFFSVVIHSRAFHELHDLRLLHVDDALCVFTICDNPARVPSLLQRGVSSAPG